MFGKTEDKYLQYLAKVEKLTNGFKKDELPKQMEPSVHSADDAFGLLFSTSQLVNLQAVTLKVIFIAPIIRYRLMILSER